MKFKDLSLDSKFTIPTAQNPNWLFIKTNNTSDFSGYGVAHSYPIQCGSFGQLVAHDKEILKVMI